MYSLGYTLGQRGESKPLESNANHIRVACAGNLGLLAWDSCKKVGKPAGRANLAHETVIFANMEHIHKHSMLSSSYSRTRHMERQERLVAAWQLTWGWRYFTLGAGDGMCFAAGRWRHRPSVHRGSACSCSVYTLQAMLLDANHRPSCCRPVTGATGAAQARYNPSLLRSMDEVTVLQAQQRASAGNSSGVQTPSQGATPRGSWEGRDPARYGGQQPYTQAAGPGRMQQ